jgi:ABC-type nickel/cobalt efflux system permease component RcnA
MTYTTKRHLLAHWRRISISVCCVLGVLALFPHTAFAHPMGNFSINHYSRLTVGADAIDVFYIVDIAEIPTHAERSAMDTNGDGDVSPQEEQSYLESVATSLPRQLLLTLNGKAATMTLGDHTLRFKAGQANLPTLRMEFNFHTPVVAGGVQTLHYEDNTYPDRLGWKEVIVAPTAKISLLSSSVPQKDLSNRLQQYPVDLLQNPPLTTSADIRWQAAVGASQSAQVASTTLNHGATASNWGGDGFANLISIEMGPWAIVLALLAAFGWGAAHAMSPGHGKTIVAAYLVGARGTLLHAIFLGATTTITHTLGVFVLGVATLVASEYILPERIYPYLSTISGVLVIAIGVSIGWSRLRSLMRGEPLELHQHDHSHAPDHIHDHAHDHVHTYDHSHDEGHSHEHDHLHDHVHDHDPIHDHPDPHTHSHGGFTHSHLPIAADGSAITWRGLLALGISGGILPCPSALVVLLGAVALGRVAFGLVLILVFSLGLATVLTAFGLLLLRAGKLFDRIPDSDRYARYLAVASAAFIVLVGAGITVQALIQMGVLSGLA